MGLILFYFFSRFPISGLLTARSFPSLSSSCVVSSPHRRTNSCKAKQAEHEGKRLARRHGHSCGGVRRPLSALPSSDPLWMFLVLKKGFSSRAGKDPPLLPCCFHIKKFEEKFYRSVTSYTNTISDFSPISHLVVTAVSAD